MAPMGARYCTGVEPSIEAFALVPGLRGEVVEEEPDPAGAAEDPHDRQVRAAVRQVDRARGRGPERTEGGEVGAVEADRVAGVEEPSRVARIADRAGRKPDAHLPPD